MELLTVSRFSIAGVFPGVNDPAEMRRPLSRHAVDTLKHFVARGMGIAVISGFSVTQEDRTRLEVIAIPEEMGGASTYGVVMRCGKHRTALLKSLLAILASAHKE
jgi:DNA-binding transcriptional LysR family regulator